MITKVLALLFACATVLFHEVGHTQEQKQIRRIGLFHVGLDHVPPSFPALRDALKELGYEEGKNIHLDWRNLPDEAAALVTAKEFASRSVDLIIRGRNDSGRQSSHD